MTARYSPILRKSVCAVLFESPFVLFIPRKITARGWPPLRVCITARSKVIGFVEEGWNVAAIESGWGAAPGFPEAAVHVRRGACSACAKPHFRWCCRRRNGFGLSTLPISECAVCGLVATAAMFNCGLCADEKCVRIRPDENCVGCPNSKAGKGPDESSETGKSPVKCDKKSDDEGEIKICWPDYIEKSPIWAVTYKNLHYINFWIILKTARYVLYCLKIYIM